MRSFMAMMAAMATAGGIGSGIGDRTPRQTKFWSALERRYWDKPNRNAHKLPFSVSELEKLSSLGGRTKKDYVKELKEKYS